MDDELGSEELESGGAPVLPPPTSSAAGTDDRYFELLAGALKTCAKYKPKFGKGRKSGTTLDQFRDLYGADPFYRWVGLDTPLMYAAHKAAGGMTSIYRQIGIGCQWVFSALVQDALGLSALDATWVYQVPKSGGGVRSLSLDGRIELDHISDSAGRHRMETWLDRVKTNLILHPDVSSRIRGAVFEVRQGYKSKDSKRQNADIANASSAYANLYVPVLLLFSTQIDEGVASRYAQARWLLLTGTHSNDPTRSTFAFSQSVLNYDLAAFFERNSERLKSELLSVLNTLLEA